MSTVRVVTIKNRFGLICHPGKTYAKTVNARFRIFMAALGEQVGDDKRTSTTVIVREKEFVLCTLIPNKTEEHPLDITFVGGEEVTFAVKGENAVHLSGIYLDLKNESDDVFIEGKYIPGRYREEVKAMSAAEVIESDKEVEDENEAYVVLASLAFLGSLAILTSVF
ncbi:hypothetical protein HPULCUR_006125 [Helicostylum pulchrum]|uniref:Nucleoplasmin-like domain-containing protein n=1 Tax=Helicostylum pulchrum TaxID=562976 RepID=A0ABP9Y110_9FUNG